MKSDLMKIEAITGMYTDSPRPQVQEYRITYQTVQFNLTSSIWLEKQMEADETQGYATLSTLLNILFYRYCNSNIVRFLLLDNEKKFSSFLSHDDSLIPVQIELESRQSFRVLTSTLKEKILEKYTLTYQQDYSRWTWQDLNGTDLKFHYGLIVDRHSWSTGVSSPLNFENQNLFLSGLDFIMLWHKKGERLILDIYFNQLLFKEFRIQQMIDSLETILDNLCKNEQCEIQDLNLITENTRSKLLCEFSGQASDIPQDLTILELIEESCRRIPNKTAFIFNDRLLSYQEFNAKSNYLANQLYQKGVRKGDLVPILMNNSMELPICIYALMKMGAVFIPIDDTWPEQRISNLIEKISPKLVLVREHFPFIEHAILTLVDSDDLQCSETKIFDVEINPNDLIYGFYTSGSSGEPKCALNIHRGLLNRFLYMTKRFQSYGNDVVLQNSRHVFDSSIWQLLWPLTNGSTVVIPKPLKELNLDYTISLIHRYRVTMTDFVPSIFNVLIDMISMKGEIIEKLKSFRQILIGGEEISPKYVQKFLSIFPNAGITNTYGPTEASIGMIFHGVTKEDGGFIPLGRPIDNTYCLILDSRLNPVPIGVIGEIYIGGICLGKGYFNDPKRTLDAFIPNPFKEIPGERLYKTGDLGYFLPNGNAVFVGRKDQQIKFGGVRIELSEIETAILKHSSIKEAKASLETSPSGEKQLTAYITISSPLKVQQVKEHLQNFLPSNMIPSRILFLEKMPLSHNGKIDRKKLKEWAKSHEIQTKNFCNDTYNEYVKELKLICSECLGITNFNLQDDFFDCGGNSLTAVQVILRIEKSFNTKISAQEFYQNSTFTKLAQLIEKKKLCQPLKNNTLDLEENFLGNLELEQDIFVSKDYILERPKNILLTGCTGFVGAHLLYELLTQTDAKIYCLLRSNDNSSALNRIIESLHYYGLESRTLIERCIPVLGDLTHPSLGINEVLYSQLTEIIDTIIHSGAKVDFVHHYSRLYKPNVLGTTEILKFACIGRFKTVHHISSLSVFPSGITNSLQRPICELDDPLPEYIPASGYSQSKWSAEKIIEQARKRGLKINVYRLGEMMPSSYTGIANPMSFYHLMVQGSLKMGVYPSSKMLFDYTPIDWAARFIVQVIKEQIAFNDNFHLFHPKGVSFQNIFDFLKSFGFSLQEVNYEQFLHLLRQKCHTQFTDAKLLSLLSLMPNEDSEKAYPLHLDKWIPELLFTEMISFTQDKVNTLLEKMLMAYPSLNASLFKPYATYLNSQGSASQNLLTSRLVRSTTSL